MSYTTLLETLRDHASDDLAHQPLFTYLRDGEAPAGQLTFAGLDQRARALAAHLQACTTVGDRVLVVFPPSLDTIVAFFACVYAGVVAVPALPPTNARTLPRLRLIAADARPRVALAPAAFVELARRHAIEDDPLGRVEWLAADTLDDRAGEWAQPSPDPRRLVFLQYTSGSTGTPKGVMVSHANLMANLGRIHAAFGLQPGEGMVSWLPPHHDMGLVGNILYPVFSGAHCVQFPPAAFLVQPYRWLRALSDHRAAGTSAPNFAYDLAAARVTEAQRASLDLSRLRFALNGAEPVRATTLRRFADTFAGCGLRPHALTPVYGLAEATLLVSSSNFGRATGAEIRPVDRTALAAGALRASAEPVSVDLVSNGPAEWGDHEVAIVDPESLERLPPGQVGEIWFRGPSVAQGYWDRPEESAATFGAVPRGGDAAYLRTGDLGAVLDGDLYVTGRLKDLMIFRGRNVYPQDVEATVEALHPAFRPNSCAAFAVDDDDALVVVQEVDPRPPISLSELVPTIRAELADQHEVVGLAAVLLVKRGHLPRTTSGKIRRSRCRELYLADGFEPVAAWRAEASSAVGAAPRTDTERRLVGLWEGLLGRGGLSLDDDFFALGGHSLLAVQVAAHLRQDFGVELSLAELFETPTVRALAARIDAADRCAELTPIPRVAGDRHPSSLAQQRLWLIDRLDDSAGAAYHLPTGLRLRGGLDHQALRGALDALVARHEVLRCRFLPGADGPIQQVRPADVGFALTERDLRELAPGARDEALARLTEEEARRPFDLSTGPLVRGILVHLAHDDHALVVTQHHISGDGWSARVLLEELCVLYDALRAGETPSLPPAPVSYLDYAAWQRATLVGPGYAHLLTYWRAQLQGAPAVLELPSDRPRPAVQSHRGGRVPVTLSNELTDQLRAVSRAHGATLFMTLLAGWAAVLHRHSGATDLVIGAPVANRPRPDLGRTVGFFVNTLALRVPVDPESTLELVLARIRTTTLAALAHQELPFDQLVEALEPRRSASHNPVFQVALALDDTPSAGAVALGDLRVEPFDVDHGGSQFDLTLQLTDRGGAVSGWLEYATDLFDRSTAERLSAHLVTLLRAIGAGDRRCVAELPLTTEAERAALLALGADRASVPTGLLHAPFEARAAERPDAVALSFEGQPLTYGALDRRANQLAHHLRALGVGPDDRVVVCLERGFDLVVAVLAVLKAGAAYVPVDPTNPAERLGFLLADCAPAVVLTTRGLALDLPAGVERLNLDEVDLTARPTEAPAVPALRPRHLAYVIYTSGSTGRPKGVMVEHHNAARLFAATSDHLVPGPDDVWTLFHSVSFDFSVWEIFGALSHGGRLVVVPGWCVRSPADFHELLCREGVTALNQTPSAFRGLVAALSATDRRAPLRWVALGGEAVELRSLAPWFAAYPEARLINGYGVTECAVFSTFRTLTATDAREGVGSPIGRSFPDQRVYLLDGRRQPVPIGVAGELYIGGAGVSRGYLNRPELTAERFLLDPFRADGARLYKTGDLARWLADGSLEYLGRNDLQVKIHGFRIELGEIEAELGRCAGVRQGVVTARDLGDGDKRLVAYVVADPGAEPDPAALRTALRRSLPEHMVPSAFVTVERLPLTTNGKLDRDALPDPDPTALPARVYEAPAGPIEHSLAEIWADLLGLERVGRRDRFFELGGHSLQVVHLIDRARQRGLAVDVRSVFAAETLADLAATVRQTDDDVEVPPNLVPADCERVLPEMLPLVQLTRAELDGLVARVPGGDANVQDIYPLAPLQEGILFHHLLHPQGDAYLLRAVLAFDHRTQLDRFLDALQQVIDRHDVLRTAVHWSGLREPVQVVQRHAPMPRTELEDSAELYARTDPRHHRLDLTRAPLLAATIAPDSQTGEWRVALVNHHLVCDHVTMEAVLTEVQRVLHGEALPPSVPYRTFVARARAVPQQVHEAWFRGQLADIDQPTAPFGVSDVRGAGDEIGDAVLPLDGPLSSRVRAAARRHGVAPAALFHAAWAVVLGRCTGRDDVVFGTVLVGRMHRGEARPVGMFINTLPIRFSLDGLTVAGGLADAHRLLGGLLEHEQAPLALAQRCSGVAPPRPLFTTLLNFRHTGSGWTDFGGAGPAGSTGLRVLRTEERTNYPLTVSVDDRGDQFVLDAQAVTGVDPGRVVRYLARVVEELAAAPDERPLTSLPMLPDDEVHQLLVTFDGPTLPRGAELVHHRFEARAAAHPDALAVVFDGAGSMTYGALDRRANALAHRLLSLGVRPDDRVALLLERGPEQIVAMLGAAKAGAAWVPLDPELPPERLGFMVADSAPVALVTQRSLVGRVSAPVTVVVDDPDALVGRPETAPVVRGLAAHHLAWVIYTSGSTGRPKGVGVEHHNAVHLIDGQLATFGPTAADRVLQFASIGFDTAIGEVFTALSVGATLVLRPRELRVPDASFAALLDAHRITVADLPTAFWHQWAEQMRAGRALPSTPLRMVIVGGEKAERRHLERWFEPAALRASRWVNAYGPTEATVTATTLIVDRATAVPEGDLPIGRPLPNSWVRILDSRGELAPVGVPGELCLGGGGVARGYLDRPDLTAERFVPDPFRAGERLYRTGDRGRWRPDGTLEFLGRSDDQVKIRGHRVELGEVEAHLAELPEVLEAVVVARRDQLVAYVVGPAASQPERLRAALAASLPEVMIPGAFVALAALPRGPSGKVDRAALPEPDAEARAHGAWEAPLGAAEVALAEVWQELLGVERVGRGDQFFELGGHSLLVVSMVERLRDRGLEVDVKAIFATPTLRDLAAAVGRAQELSVPPNAVPEGCDALTPQLLPLIALTQAELDGLVASVPGGAPEVQDVYPLAPLQAGILFHHLAEVEGDAYLLRSVLQFADHRRLDAFLAALQRVVDRHDVLRTSVHWEGLREPVQVVHRRAAVPVALLDPGEDALERLLHATDPRRVRLDLTRAPLLAATAVEDPSTGEWLLGVLNHHLVSDHVTVDLVLAEVLALLDGSEPPPVGRPYREFVARSRVEQDHETYFRARLLDVTEPTAPFGVLDVRGSGADVSEAELALPAPLARRLRDVARVNGVTPAALFHAAWAVVLARITGQADVVFGTLLLGRLDGSESERALGVFINTLPLRVTVAEQTVRRLVRDTWDHLRGLLQHEQAPLALALRCSGVLAPRPLFTSLLNYRHGRATVARDGMRVLRNEERTNYPVAVSVDDLGEAFAVVAQCAAGIDPAQVAAHLVTAVGGVVEGLAGSLDPRADRLPVLPADERLALLRLHGPEVTHVGPPLVHQWFEARADADPDGIAVEVDGSPGALTARELDVRANQLAHHLIALGVRRGDRVALCMERSLDLMVAVLAALKAGAAWVPVDPSYPPERITFLLQDSEPRVVVALRGAVDLLPETAPTVVLDDDAAAVRSRPTTRPVVEELGPRDLAYVIYTSGSTGSPKGAMNQHDGVVNHLLGFRGALGLGPDDRVLQKAPFGFDVSVWEMFLPLLTGARVVFARPGGHQDPRYLAEVVERAGITTLDLVPSMVPLFLDRVQPGGCRGLRRVVCGGEALPWAVRQRFAEVLPHVALHHVYGPTEAAVAVTHWRCGPADPVGKVPIGRPLPNVRLYVLADGMELAPAGAVGELYIGGVAVARGYWSRPELTAERFVQDPFGEGRLYRTGDRVRRLSDGALEFVGRADLQVKIRGLRVELGEVEAALLASPGVREAAAVSRDGRLVAYLVGANLDLADVRGALAARLPEPLIPSAFVQLDALPVGPNGKLDRRALPAPDAAAVLHRGHTPPEGPVEQLLAEIWQQVLGVERVGRDDQFFELGGHSLLVVTLIERLRRHGLRADVRAVFAAPTLRELAVALRRQTAAAPPNPIPADCSALTPDLLPLCELTQTELDALLAQVPGGAAEIGDVYPLAPLQEGILFHHLLETEGDAYLLRSVLTFDGRARLDAFLVALQAVVDHHDVLRTSIHWVGLRAPVQVVHRRARVPVTELAPEGGAHARLLDHTDPSRVRIDPSRAPLLAATVIEDPARGEWLLALHSHHLICDHVTLEVVLEEVRDRLAGREPPAAAATFRAFVATARAAPADAHERYFRERLHDVTEPTAPFGVLDVRGTGDRVRAAEHALPTPLARRLRDAARAARVTPAVLFHLAWALVVARASGRDDVVFGTLLLGRSQGSEAADRALGVFVNTLPLRLTIGRRTVRALVDELWRELGQLLTHEQAPLALAQRCSGVPAPSPLFTSLLNYRHTRPAEPWEGMWVSENEERTNYPLTMAVDDLGVDFTLTARCAAGIDPTRVVRYVATAIEGLVDALEAHPDRPASQVPVLPEDERHQLLYGFNQTAAEFRRTESEDRQFPGGLVHALVEAQVEATPDGIAVEFEGHRATYRQLDQRANQWAHHLRALGVGPDDRVGLCLERSLELSVAVLAVLKAGGAWVPLDPDLPRDRLAYLIDDAAPVVVLTQRHLRGRLPDDTPTVTVDDDVEVERLGQLPTHRPVVAGLSAKNLAYVLYTSGSTGRPKGVANLHEGVVNLLGWAQQELRLDARDRLLQKTPIGFDVSVRELLLPLVVGARLVSARPGGHLDPRYLAEQIDAAGVTITHFVPSMLPVFLDHLPAGACAGLRHVLSGGESLTWSLQQRFARALPHVALHHLYGPTEATVCVTHWRCDPTKHPGVVPIGGPIANVRLYVLGADLEPAPLGAPGELYIGGVAVARGYWNRPELTAERFVDDPFTPGGRCYRTGDLVRWLPDGVLEFLGRADSQVKIRGLRVELGEIEARLLELPTVREVTAGLRADRLVAWVVLTPGAELQPASWREALAASLPEYMVPSAFVALDALPLGPTGKLDRRALPDPDAGAGVQRTYEPPSGPLETLLAGIWAELLGVQRVGRDDQFFELGGHSLLVVAMVERLRRHGLAAEVRALFAAPTLRGLAAALTEARTAAVPPNRIPPGCVALTPELLPLVELTQAELDGVVASVPGGAAEVQDVYPLAPLQEGILFHHLLEPDGDAYLIRTVVAFDGRARLDAFLGALQQVVDRHDVLRTSVHWAGLRQPVQVVHRHATVPRTELPAGPDALQRLLHHTDPARVRLDLTRAPLLAATCAATPDGEWLLALHSHHLIDDNVTLQLILDEIRAALDGRLAALPPSRPYRNHVAQVRAVAPAEHDAWFRAQLGDVEEPTAPFGLMEVRGHAKDVLDLDPSVVERVRAAARRSGVSPAVLFHVAWAVVCAKTAGRDDVVFGTTLSGRLSGSDGADRALGLFINTLPVRVPLAGRSAAASVAETQARLAELLVHEQAALALAQRCSRVAPPTPLFSTLLNYRRGADEPERGFTGLRMVQLDDRTNYPISISVDDFGAGMALTAHTTSALEPRRVNRYLATAIAGLVGLLEDTPDAPVLTLPILAGDERSAALGGPVERHPAGLLHHGFEAHAAARPEAVALTFEGRQVTYGELERRANQLAHELVALGVRPEDRVALCLDRGEELVVAVLGALKAGAAYLPIDPGSPPERVAFTLADGAPRVVLTDQALLPTLAAHAPDGATLVALDGDAARAALSARPSDPPRVPELAPHHLAYVIYTSGSTGRPKGVMVEHRHASRLFAAAEGLAGYGFGPDDVWTLFHSIAFDFSVWELFGALSHGGRLVVVPAWRARSGPDLLSLLARERVTVFNATPSAFRAVAAADDPEALALRLVIFGGEALEAHTLARWVTRHDPRRVRLVNGYGVTECAVFSTFHPLGAADLGASGATVAIGRPISDTRVYLLDPQLEPVPAGVVGELYLGGDGVARGYLARPELTAERFLTDPFRTDGSRLYKTGDLGRRRPDGALEFLGRNDFQVKLHGYRIELGEIEAQLTRCAGVREAAVSARVNGGDKQLVAYVVLEPGVELRPLELRNELGRALPEHMLPAAFVGLERLPLNTNGKLDRQALPAPDASARVSRPFLPPEGPLEAALAEVWCDLLGLEQVGRDDRFFELGGHSLLAVSLIERLRQLGFRAEVRSIFAAQTLAEAAAALKTGTARPEVPPNRISDGCVDLTPDLLPLVDLTQAELDGVVAGVAGGAANVQDIYPLAPLQEGILFHHLLQAEGDAYLVRTVVGFDTRARLDAFLDALQRVVDHHDILRSAVAWAGLREPVQVVHRRAPVPRVELAPGEQASERLLAATDPRRVRMDLTRAPLLSATTAQQPDGEWLLAVVNHHLVCDHVTMEMVLAQVRGVLHGEPLPPAAPYRAFVAQARATPAEVHEAFFRARLHDIDAPTAPFGVLDVLGTGDGFGEARVPLDPDLARRARAEARRHGVSAAAPFHTAWAVVCARCTGQDDVVFGTVLLGRMQGSEGADRALGVFINTLPIRLSVGGRSALQGVTETWRHLRELLEHEQASLALAQRCSGVAAPRPLFTTLLNYRHSTTEAPAWEGVRDVRSEERTNYPITMSVDDLGQDFSLSVLAAPGIDPQRVAGYLATAFAGLVDALAHAPDRALRALDLLPEEERRLLLDRAAAPAPAGDELVHHRFERAALAQPDAVAVSHGEQRLTYAELEGKANRLARHLRDLGVRPDDRVALMLSRGLDLIVAVVAAVKAGAAYVPLDPSYPERRTAYQLEDCAPAALITEAALRDRLPIPGNTVVLDDPQVQHALASLPAGRSVVPELGPHNLAYVIYTSGSTGWPKGVAMPHAGLVNLLRWQQAAGIDQRAPTRTLQFAALGFDVAFQEIFSTLGSGGELVLLDEQTRQDPAALVQLVEARGVGCLFLPFVALQRFAEAAAVAGAELRTLRHVVTAGEQLRITPAIARLFDRADGPTLHNHYGPTESHVVTAHTLAGSPETWPALPPIGRPITHARVLVLDPQRDLSPVGVAGEIHLGGEPIARGYWNRPDLTAERFVPDPFGPGLLYRTGDLGRWLPDGTLEYLGRNDHQVKIRGFRVELGEVEARLAECAGVREVVVVVRGDAGDQRLVAYVVLEPGASWEVAAVKAQLAGSLPEHLVPSAFVRLEALPVSPNGKVNRSALPAPDDAAVATREYAAPVGPVEQALATIWADLLHLGRVGRHDQFFELGGHSLLVVRLIDQLRQRGLHAGVRDVFTAPVLADLAQRVRPAARPEPDAPLLELTEAERAALEADVPAGEVRDVYPLAPLQQGILFHHLLQTEGDAYLLRWIVGFDSRARLDACLAALQQVVDRHDILRTSLHWVGLREPVQVVHRRVPVRVIELDGDPSALLAATDPRHTRLDLTRAPLFDAHVVHDPATGAHQLAVRCHHVLVDHVSVGHVFAELRAVLDGRSDTLPPPAPYRAFVAHTRATPAAEHERYFRGRLGDVDEPTAPFGVTDVHAAGAAVGEVVSPLDPLLTEQVRAVARRSGVSPAVLFHVAWARVLGALTGRGDVVFGTTLSGRMHGDDHTVGLFINTLPIRVAYTGRSVAECLADTHRQLAELLEHEQAPLALAQRSSRVQPPTPLFTSLFNYRHDTSGQAELPGIHLIGADDRTNYPITVSIDDGDGLATTVQCASGIDPHEVSGYLAAAVAGLVGAEPDRLLSSLPILTDDQRRRLLPDEPRDFGEGLLHLRFRAQAALRPHALAVSFDGQSLTYGALADRAHQLANHLVHLGVRPDDRVAVCLDRGVELVVAVLGILASGAAYVLADCRPVALVTDAA
ncbi:MAG: non-ribosomal peptide synthase/polyketide synthase, partial [Myxococcota bacterium]